jgi:hypothetical protein
MSLPVLSVLGVAALGGGLAAGISALAVVAGAWLVAVALLNAIRVLGELLEAVDASGPMADGRQGQRRVG